LIEDPKRYRWSEKNAKAVRENPAVYELYNMSELIYIGSTGDLHERFTHYWSTNFDDDPCKQKTDHYKREYVSTELEARKKERQYLIEYQKRFGKLPICNEVIPTV
jgi:excinuclease UvrABC nuclease subunit